MSDGQGFDMSLMGMAHVVHANVRCGGLVLVGCRSYSGRGQRWIDEGSGSRDGWHPVIVLVASVMREMGGRFAVCAFEWSVWLL